MKKTHPKTSNQFVTSIWHLNELIEQGHHDYALVLAGGLGVYSRKTITWNGTKRKYKVINHIDDTVQHLSADEMMDREKTHIGMAIPLNCLIAIIE